MLFILINLLLSLLVMLGIVYFLYLFICIFCLFLVSVRIRIAYFTNPRTHTRAHSHLLNYYFLFKCKQILHPLKRAYVKFHILFIGFESSLNRYPLHVHSNFIILLH